MSKESPESKIPLNPCIVCGGTPFQYIMYWDGDCFMVRCAHCNQSSSEPLCGHTRDTAAESWNDKNDKEMGQVIQERFKKLELALRKACKAGIDCEHCEYDYSSKQWKNMGRCRSCIDKSVYSIKDFVGLKYVKRHN